MEVALESEKIRKAIRKKARALKTRELDLKTSIAKTLKPVIEPLQTIAKNTKGEIIDISSTPIHRKRPRSDSATPAITPYKNRLSKKTRAELFDDDSRDLSFRDAASISVQDVIDHQQPAELIPNREKYGKNAQVYMHYFINDTQKQIDHVYGPVLDPHTDTLKLGNKTLNFDQNDNILINNHVIGHPSIGVLELLFMSQPDTNIIKNSDYEEYKKILEMTSSHRMSNLPNGRIKSNRGSKYKDIIKSLFRHETTDDPIGSGLNKLPSQLEHNNNPIEYKHWDDPNELVDRLELLIASETAGNTGHKNEIQYIIEELEEAGLIKTPLFSFE